MRESAMGQPSSDLPDHVDNASVAVLNGTDHARVATLRDGSSGTATPVTGTSAQVLDRQYLDARGDDPIA
jgi:hypothetical protein